MASHEPLPLPRQSWPAQFCGDPMQVIPAATLQSHHDWESVFHTYFYSSGSYFLPALLPVVFAGPRRGFCPIIAEHSPVICSWRTDQSAVMAHHYRRKLASAFFCGHEHSYLEGNMTGVFCSLRKTQVACPLSHRFWQFSEPNMNLCHGASLTFSQKADWVSSEIELPVLHQ